MRTLAGIVCVATIVTCAAGCGSTTGTELGADASIPVGADAASNPGADAAVDPRADLAMGPSDQRPPVGTADLEAWLAAGSYKAWHCETAAHPARPPGAHGTNRVCSNDLLSASTSGDFPVGAASVKELYSGASVTGYTVAVRVAAGAGGDKWWWYERAGSGAPFANGLGDSGSPKSVCVSCHSGAARDFVYTQVK